MKRTVNLSKASNRICEHCAYYRIDTSSRSRTSNNLCAFYNIRKRYYQKCNNFIWAAKYLSINNEKDQYDKDGNLLCRRCGKPLTESDSIVRKFGLVCYNKRLHYLLKRSKRLF